MIDKVILENKYTFNSWQDFFSLLSAFSSLIIRTLFSDCRSSTTPLTTSNFVCKVNNIFQNELEVNEGEVEELGSLNKILTVKEQNMDKELKNYCQAFNMKFFF